MFYTKYDLSHLEETSFRLRTSFWSNLPQLQKHFLVRKLLSANVENKKRASFPVVVIRQYVQKGNSPPAHETFCMDRIINQ